MLGRERPHTRGPTVLVGPLPLNFWRHDAGMRARIEMADHMADQAPTGQGTTRANTRIPPD